MKEHFFFGGRGRGLRLVLPLAINLKRNEYLALQRKIHVLNLQKYFLRKLIVHELAGYLNGRLAIVVFIYDYNFSSIAFVFSKFVAEVTTDVVIIMYYLR